MTPTDLLRLYAQRMGWVSEDLEYVVGLLAEADRTARAELQPSWTSKAPSAEGYYWWRPSSANSAMVVRIDANGYVYEPGHWPSPMRDVRDYGGEWAGPLIPPTAVASRPASAGA